MYCAIMHPLTRSILATVCYYDVMEYPLTSFEVWRYLTHEDPDGPAQYRNAVALSAVMSVLRDLVRDGRLEITDGFYTLPKRTMLVVQRRRRTLLSVHKLRRMRRAVRILRYLPFMRQVWGTGRVAMKNATADSDWDVLIVLAAGHIWTGRLIVTVVTHLLGLRRTDTHHADHLCLNYWITTDSMAISLDDRYSAHEYMMARPLWASVDPVRFLTANAWIGRYRPHYDTMVLPSPYRVPDTDLAHAWRRMWEYLLGSARLEAWLRNRQRARIMANPKTFRKGSMIVANDHELVFLPSPHSPRVLAAYHALCTREGLRRHT